MLYMKQTIFSLFNLKSLTLPILVLHVKWDNDKEREKQIFFKY